MSHDRVIFNMQHLSFKEKSELLLAAKPVAEAADALIALWSADPEALDNKLASLEATLVRNSVDSLTLSNTHRGKV